MTEFYIPKAQTVKLPGSGRLFKLWRGIHTIPDELADSHIANDLGIKPVEEMTDEEYRLLGMKRPFQVPPPVLADTEVHEPSVDAIAEKMSEKE